MGMNIVIVESPAKAKTIEKYLGKDYKVLASYGHVRDLMPKEGAIDTENSYTPKYEIIEKNEKRVDAIAKALKKADALLLAPDPDREGEAIAWHLHELLQERGLLQNKDVHRIVFHEITKPAVQNAVANPRVLSDLLVNAQQARRALDYLYGFNISPLLWKKISPGLSAGRVQSAALRLIVEREKEIDAFQKKEYWTIEATVNEEPTSFAARLAEYQNEKVQQFSFVNEEQAYAVRNTLLTAADGKVRVGSVTKKQRKRNPTAPFTTSTLQQEAARKLGFTTQRTMMTAQRLYEGLETADQDEGSVGLITYMRTDSVTLATEALDEIRALIRERYGAENLPDEVRVYKTKAKNAQEAHEAIRPTSVLRLPSELKNTLNQDQYKLYDLIWKRTVACQMVHAVFDMVALDLLPTVNPTAARLRATGSTLVKPGFMAVYQEGQDDVKGTDDDRTLPVVNEGDVLTLAEVRAEQHFTEPPPRFTEASLVKTLEEFGIGRPSTYASIIATLKNREYVEMDGKRFIPTDVAIVVINFLTKHFELYVDYDFTARMEDTLDEISRGEQERIPVLDNFWQPFHKLLTEKEETVTREDAGQARMLGTDPKSGKPVSVRIGRYGTFAQIGTREDEDKPKFAGLRPGQKMATIQLDEALELFKLPRKLGETPEGEPVSASIGRFGPYVRYGDKFASMRDDDPYTISLERALIIVAEKKEADANRLILDFADAGIQVLNGRYGPYITNKEKNAKVPKDREPKSLTLEECIELLAKAPLRKKRGAKKKTKKKTKKKARKKAGKKSRKKATPKASAPAETKDG
ncbi:MAG: DNA topoisomerase I [Gammaproteobacteria bacterium]|jgi:DNA topoisomerase-1|nr:DNA topoisomerase I [Gammaproteobacteria bacterium]MDP7659699.1 DNA topoisomerase I [Gammaproteobacteria bacterium]